MLTVICIMGGGRLYPPLTLVLVTVLLIAKALILALTLTLTLIPAQDPAMYSFNPNRNRIPNSDLNPSLDAKCYHDS